MMRYLRDVPHDLVDRLYRRLGWMSRADRARWAATQSRADVAELTARWLEGEIASRPGYVANCGPDPETTELVQVLAAANRAGYLTECSQPGLVAAGYDGAGWKQRAAVDGFAGEETLAWLEEAVAGTELVLTAARVRRWSWQAGGRSTVVTTRAEWPYTWFGRTYTAGHLRDTWSGYGLCGDAALDELVASWQVTIVDPQWGRDDLLWPTLGVALAHQLGGERR